MKFVDLKCTNCGGKLKKIDKDHLYCDFCHSEYLIDDETPDYYIINNHYYEKSPAALAPPTNKRGLLAGLLFLGVVLLLGFLFFSQYDPYPKAPGETLPDRDKPESEIGIMLAERMFHKPIEVITAEDLNRVKYLEVFTETSGNFFQFQYGFDEWTGQEYYPYETIAFEFAGKLDSLDFASFNGLNYLNFHNSYDIERSDTFSLKGLDQLKYYGHDFNQSLQAIIEGIPNKEQLQYLATQIRSDSEVASLTSFPNLKHAELTYIADEANLETIGGLTQLEGLALTLYDHKDIKVLSRLTNLKTLALQFAENVSDYAVLYSLPNIEQLTISRGAMLKDLQFVQNMPKLKSLTLVDTAIQNLAPLENNQTLLAIRLENNEAIKDYTVLTSIKNLTNIQLTSFENKLLLPNFSGLTQLSKARVSQNFVEAIANSNAIHQLTVEVRRELDLTLLGALANLETLAFTNTTSESVVNSKQLLSYPNLTSLTFENVNIDWAEREQNIIFQLPNLETLHIKDDSSIHVNVSQPITGPKLKTLIIENPQYLRILQSGEDIEDVQVFADQLANISTLQTLKLPNAGLTNVAFASELTQLQTLDVQGNFIQDVTPLVKLPELREVNLFNNPVSNMDLLEGVYVIQ